jgi:putative DNA methylase
VQKRKLIEVALPLETINRESAREKSIRQGHPATLHLWWARRPLAAARAVLFAQLVDDPSSRPEEFPTEELQRGERERLHKLIERLVVWENIRDEKLLKEAHAEILKSTNGHPPPVLDPFAGGGTIPLEAQRLGLQTYASDLNPVAVLIEKALIEIPPKFRDQPPIFPGLATSELREWKGVEGLGADIASYGGWLREKAEERVGHLYPKAMFNGVPATVIAWIWARTVTCPNPACRIELPLVRTWVLSKKKSGTTYIVPSVVNDSEHPSGRRIAFSVERDASTAANPKYDGTIARGNAVCVSCDSAVSNSYIRAQATSVGLGSRLMATVADGNRQRVYLAPTANDEHSARVEPPSDVPDQTVSTPNHDVDRLPMYGMPRWCDAFTPRQLHALTVLSDLVMETHDQVMRDGGTEPYADAIATYLGLAMSRVTDLMNSLVTWSNSRDQPTHLFARQVIPMAWDYVEVNPFAGAAGDIAVTAKTMSKAILNVVPAGVGEAVQADASTRDVAGFLISTDPPYYDNVGYSELSDFFYVWLRRSLKSLYQDLLATMLVPKAQELVANPNRHGGRAGAERFFEEGFRQVFANARAGALDGFPITVYYAFKQTESDDSGEASTGWETLLEGMIRSGWEITSTWPLRSERGARMISLGTNALASAIVLSLRPRSSSAAMIDRRGFIAALESELPEALRKLQQGQIAPVDLPQASIGPGMAVFSHYSAVLEPDGTQMTVRAALVRINEILDRVLNEQEGDFDATSRFAIAWYRQHGYDIGKFGDADNLARARNTSVDAMDRDGIVRSRAGFVQLIKPENLGWDYDPVVDSYISNWEVLQHLIKVLERDGIAPAGDFLRAALGRADGVVDPDLVKELSHLLFRIAESNGWTKDALSFNGLVTSWPEVLEVARSDHSQTSSSQSSFDFSQEDD